jgi:hypothetical protein
MKKFEDYIAWAQGDWEEEIVKEEEVYEGCDYVMLPMMHPERTYHLAKRATLGRLDVLRIKQLLGLRSATEFLSAINTFLKADGAYRGKAVGVSDSFAVWTKLRIEHAQMDILGSTPVRQTIRACPDGKDNGPTSTSRSAAFDTALVERDSLELTGIHRKSWL